MTEKDRRLLTQRTLLQTAAVIGHISHERAKTWLKWLPLSFFLRISSSSCYFLPPPSSPTLSCSHTHSYNWGCFFTLSRNPGEPRSWPTCNYSIFRVSSKRHREARDMALSRISKNGLRESRRGVSSAKFGQTLQSILTSPVSCLRCLRCYINWALYCLKPNCFTVTLLTFCNHNYSGNSSQSAILTITPQGRLKQHDLNFKYCPVRNCLFLLLFLFILHKNPNKIK